MAKETILVVEDETLVGLELREDLERLGYVVPEVIETGEDVVPAVARLQPDLVLMDIRLKGFLDGIEAAFQAKAEFDMPVIYLTAYSDSETLRRAALTSPDGFLLKPFDERELAANVQIALARSKGDESLRRELRGAMALADALDEPALIADPSGRIAHANTAALLLLGVDDPIDLSHTKLATILDLPSGDPGFRSATLRKHRADGAPVVASIHPLKRSDGREYGSLALFDAMGKQERKLLEASAASANANLEKLLPDEHSAGVDFQVGGFLVPCLSGSGDIFDVIPLNEEETAFYGVDVMGHGVVASLMAFSLHDVLPMIARGPDGSSSSPSAVVKSLYDRYCRKGSTGTSFFTIAYGLLENETGAYSVVRAGHTPVLHLSADGTKHAHYTKGAAVGIMHDAEIEEARGRLLSGDRLLVLSDGLLEAFKGDLLLEQAIEGVFAFAEGLRGSKLEDFVGAFKERAKEYSTKRTIEDDISLLVIERQ
jgi:Serine phosphatase RsbU, regulator of sigma subunit